MAMNRDAIHRKLKIFHEGRGKGFNGSVVRFSGEFGKHQIKLESLKKESERNLRKRKFHWMDLIGLRSSSGPHALSTSKFMCVRKKPGIDGLRPSRELGRAATLVRLNPRRMLHLHMMSMQHETSRPVNFKAEQVSEAEMNVLKTTEKESTTALPVWGLSKFRGVYWQKNKNRERWMSRYTLPLTGTKRISTWELLSAQNMPHYCV
jgi:hypothetical protein